MADVVGGYPLLGGLSPVGVVHSPVVASIALTTAALGTLLLILLAVSYLGFDNVLGAFVAGILLRR